MLGACGLVKAVREQLLGSSWQRCRVHFTRNAQDLVPRSARSMIASAIVLEGLWPRFAAVAKLLADAPDLLAHFAFPETHRAKIRSTNPLERLNKEIQASQRRRRDLPAPQPCIGHRPRRDDPRRAGRRVAGRQALLPARDHGGDRRRHHDRGGKPATARGELIRHEV